MTEEYAAFPFEESLRSVRAGIGVQLSASRVFGDEPRDSPLSENERLAF